MEVLITDRSGIWLFSCGGRRLGRVGEELPYPCQPCAAPGIWACACAQTRECVCVRSRDSMLLGRMPCVPGVNSMCFSSCGRYLFQLSSEADCIHARSTAAGELLFAAPAGVFPRMMRLINGGQNMLAAGGAVGEAYVFSLPELRRIRTIETRHACFAAAQWRDGLVLVCAAEGEDIHTVVYTLPKRSLRPRKLMELPGLPGSISICPDGVHALLSTGDGLMKVHLPTGALLWNRPEWALCMRMECRGDSALVSDTLAGDVWLMNHHRPWEREQIFQGNQAEACFLEMK